MNKKIIYKKCQLKIQDKNLIVWHNQIHNFTTGTINFRSHLQIQGQWTFYFGWSNIDNFLL